MRGIFSLFLLKLVVLTILNTKYKICQLKNISLITQF